jgi:hypothetical protein
MNDMRLLIRNSARSSDLPLNFLITPESQPV